MYQVESSRAAASADKSARARVPPVVYWIGLTSLLTDIATEMIASTLPVFMFSVLLLSPLQVGFLDGLYQGGAALIRVWAGYVADKRRDNKGVAFLGYLLSVLARVGLLLSASAGMLLAAVSLFADRIGKGIRTAPRDALIAGHTPSDAIGAAFGIHRSMDAVGAMIGPLLAAALLWWRPQGFDLIFALSIGFGLLGLFVLWRFVTEPPLAPTSEAQASATAQARLSFAEALRALWAERPFVRLLFFAGVLSLFTISDGLVFVGLQKKIGFSDQFVPLLFVGTAFVFLATAPFVGARAAVFGYEKTFILGYALLAVVYAWFALGSLSTLPEMLAIVVLFGLHYAATDGVLAALAVQRLPLAVRTTGLAAVTTVTGLTRIASSTCFGWLWQSQGQTAAALVFATGMALCVVLISIYFTRVSSRL
jgi:MFS family permease